MIKIFPAPVFNSFFCRLSLSAVLVCCLSVGGLTQEITLSGLVSDAQSAEPVPFATVSVPGTTVGESADFSGSFILTLEEIPDSLAVSALGYRPAVFAYAGETEMTFRLEAADYSLDEVVVRPTEDPAVALFKKILNAKPRNNPEYLPQYSCEIYDKMQIDLINVTEGFQNFFINRPFKFVFEQLDSVSEDEPFLPIFITEKLSDYEYRREPQSRKNVIKASNVSGFEGVGIAQLLDVLYQNFNIYDNWIPVLGKDFVSPISEAGFTYYNYYLTDSASIDNRWCYQVQFFPKTKSSPTFSGDFWVQDTVFGIKRVNLFLFENAELNFVQKMNLVQQYDQTDNGFWQPTKSAVTVTFDKVTKPLLWDVFSKKARENAPNVQGKRSIFYRDYRDTLLPEKPVPDVLTQHDEAYWQARRHVPLTQREQSIHHLIDTLQQTDIYNSWRRWTTLLFTGYLPVGGVDIGNIYGFYGRRPIEGNRFKIGLRTNSRLSKKWLLGSYLAYGTEDKRFKFGVNGLYIFQKYPRKELNASVIHDTRRSADLNGDFSLAAEGILAADFVRRGDVPFKLLNVRYHRLQYYSEYLSGFSWRLGTEQQFTEPFFNFSYRTDPDDFYNQPQIEEYTHTAVALRLRYAYKETFLSGVFNRASLGSPFPIVSAEYKVGLRGIAGGGFDFYRVDFSFFDRVDLPPAGYFKLNADAGKIWGRLPYPLLHVPGGNEGFVSQFGGFNLIPEYYFAADCSLRAAADYHFDGFIFKKLPLLKKTGWRTVANYRILWGDMTAENRAANQDNFLENTDEDDLVRLRVPDTVPYSEISVGVENILKVLRVEYIWKLSYRDDGRTQNGGLRFNLAVKF